MQHEETLATRDIIEGLAQSGIAAAVLMVPFSLLQNWLMVATLGIWSLLMVFILLAYYYCLERSR